jgi:hypothetical protein
MAATTPAQHQDPCPSTGLKVAEAGEESRETMIYTYRHVKETGSSLSGNLGWSDLPLSQNRRTCRNGEVVDRVGVLDEHDAALFSEGTRFVPGGGQGRVPDRSGEEARVLVVCVLRPTRQYGVAAPARLTDRVQQQWYLTPRLPPVGHQQHHILRRRSTSLTYTYHPSGLALRA